MSYGSTSFTAACQTPHQLRKSGECKRKQLQWPQPNHRRRKRYHAHAAEWLNGLPVIPNCCSMIQYRQMLRVLNYGRVTMLLLLPVLNHLLPLEPFVYLRLLIGILSLCTSAHLTILSLFNPALNPTFSLLPITSSHPHASTSDSTFDFRRHLNIRLTPTLRNSTKFPPNTMAHCSPCCG